LALSGSESISFFTAGLATSEAVITRVTASTPAHLRLRPTVSRIAPASFIVDSLIPSIVFVSIT
jgi:hypothetical protein